MLNLLQILFDGGTVEDYLDKVHDFLTANPNEVITLLFTNPEGASLPDLWDPPFQKSGIADLAYVPPSIPVKQSDVRIPPPSYNHQCSYRYIPSSGRRSAT